MVSSVKQILLSLCSGDIFILFWHHLSLILHCKIKIVQAKLFD